MSLGRAVHQKPGGPGRNAGGRGEAASPGRDGLLAQALASANMGAAWKHVKSKTVTDRLIQQALLQVLQRITQATCRFST
ncbi:hypothetical protein [Zoogloea sp.]|uniref:hypothetical protein n=1 Tax=Zoogloea sp. TaxID=49181 RepID=UPI002621D038|nr:hypothetical protein [Zoogloea sp.]MDD3352615.1 hypothetical protein [Zoogloea sp.]